jgi:hypothetical protein
MRDFYRTAPITTMNKDISEIDFMRLWPHLSILKVAISQEDSNISPHAKTVVDVKQLLQLKMDI